MKKTLLLTLALLFSVTIFAQDRAFLVRETFDSTKLPNGWLVYGPGSTNWKISQTNKAGSECNELMLYFDPGFNDISRLVTKSVNLKDVESVAISFKHYLDNFSNSSTIGIATSSDNGKTWNDAWSQTYSKTGKYVVNEVVSTPDMGKDNVKFCLYFSGDSYNLYSWHFDDLEIFTQENIDLRMLSIDIPEIIEAGNTEVKFTVQNIGKETVNSFTIQSVNTDGTMKTQTFETELEPFEIKQFSLENQLTIKPGSYNLPITIENVNNTQDNDLSNNNLTKEFAVTIGHTQRIPMIEHFSSSTCGPCKDVNILMNKLTENNINKYTYTKYPLAFPNPGDPYHTTYAKERTLYYGVTSAPQLFLDGVGQGYGAITNQNFEDRYNEPAYVNIRGAFDVDYDSIKIVADFMSYVNLNNVRAYISVNEKTTKHNVGDNGETEFHHISLTMSDNAKGKDINIKAGEYQRLEYTLNITETFMEDIGDLEVALWLQNYETKEIYNSHFAYEYTTHCYPVQNLSINVDGNEKNIKWEAPEKGNPTGYNILINNELISENSSELSYNFTSSEDTFIVEVIALYEDGKTSVGIAKIYYPGVNIMEYNELDCNIYPNPANDRLTIATEANVEEIAIYDIYGRTVSQQDNKSTSQQVVDVANLETGIYFINIKTDKGNVVRRFIKN